MQRLLQALPHPRRFRAATKLSALLVESPPAASFSQMAVHQKSGQLRENSGKLRHHVDRFPMSHDFHLPLGRSVAHGRVLQNKDPTDWPNPSGSPTFGQRELSSTSREGGPTPGDDDRLERLTNRISENMLQHQSAKTNRPTAKISQMRAGLSRCFQVLRRCRN